MAILKDSYNTGDDSGISINTAAGYIRAQTWTATAIYNASQIKVKVYRAGSPGTVTVALWDISSGDPNSSQASGTFAGNSVTANTAGEWVTITLDSSVSITKDTVYAVVLDDSNSSAGNQIFWRTDDDALYAGGLYKWSANSGSTWNDQSSDDLMFEIWGEIGSPVDKTYSKELVAIAGNQIYYEASAGTMSILSAATEDIDTAIPLTAVEAFQKLFIANTTKLRVADFINTKIVTSNLGSNPPDSGTILTGGSSGAKMVVDYITSLSSSCTIYGKRTTTATFSSGETVTGTDDDSNAISFAMTAVNEVAPPHWYNWTVFGGDSSFGTMPDSAYLVARYRGRLVLSGNPDYPHQWYMSKVGFPFNFLYGSTDPLTAVAGNNVDAGEIGDIVRALIPFGDDFMIFGCANSIHLMDGDPAHGGSIDELDDKTGIFGPWAWCIDGVGNLWFYGTGGIYKMAGGRSRPINISQSHLPKLVTNWAAVPGTHRIVLTYDPFRNGIIISRTTLADGTNLNYYYDFKTEGFYPETYPNACGIFSSHYYDSDVAGTKGLVLGCNDGYIRNFYDTKKDDDSTAINSYVTYPIESLAEDNDKEGKLTSLTVELAGGAGGGDFGDTDGVSYKLYKGRDAETVLEKMKAEIAWATGQVYVVGDLRIYSSIEYRCITAHTSDAAGPPYEEPDTNTTDWETVVFSSGTLSGTGRKNRIRTRLRGAYLGIKFFNSTATKTWAINRVFGDVRETGRMK